MQERGQAAPACLPAAGALVLCSVALLYEGCESPFQCAIKRRAALRASKEPPAPGAPARSAGGSG
jgi:hypothetical protein